MDSLGNRQDDIWALEKTNKPETLCAGLWNIWGSVENITCPHIVKLTVSTHGGWLMYLYVHITASLLLFANVPFSQNSVHIDLAVEI